MGAAHRLRKAWGEAGATAGLAEGGARKAPEAGPGEEAAAERCGGV